MIPLGHPEKIILALLTHPRDFILFSRKGIAELDICSFTGHATRLGNSLHAGLTCEDLQKIIDTLAFVCSIHTVSIPYLGGLSSTKSVFFLFLSLLHLTIYIGIWQGVS